MKKINWKQGIKRLHYFVLTMCWLLWLAIVHDQGAFHIGETLVYMLLFTFGYMVFFNFVAWVVRGFLPNQNSHGG